MIEKLERTISTELKNKDQTHIEQQWTMNQQQQNYCLRMDSCLSHWGVCEGGGAQIHFTGLILEGRQWPDVMLGLMNLSP